MMEFNGPDGMMMFGPDMPMMREQIEPLLRQRLNNLPNRIQIRRPMGVRRIVTPDVIRDLVATAIRDAQSALRRLAADGVA